MKRKGLSVFIVMMMLVVWLTGCSGNTSSQSKTAKDTSAAKNPTDIQSKEDNDTYSSETSGNMGEIEKITVYIPSGGNATDKDMVMEAVNKITREKIGVEVDLKIFEFGQWFQQYSLFLSGTEDIDILANYGDFSSAVSQGAALDLTEMLQQYGQDIVALEGDFLKSGQIGGVQYAIPVYSAYVNTMGIQYRADIVRELNLDEQVAQVKKLEDWGPILAAVKEAYPDMTPFVTNSGNTAYTFNYAPWDSLGDNYGVLMDGGSSTDIVNLFETDEYKRMCTVMHEWYTKGYSSKDIQTQTDGFSTLAKNDAAFSTLGNYDFNSAVYNSTSIGKEIGSIAIGEPTAKTYTNVTYTIMSTSKHPEAAMKFLNLWFNDDEVTNLLKYGIEDVHYQIKADGTGAYLDGQDMRSCTWHVATNINNTAGFRWETEDPDYAQKLINDNTNSKKSAALGFKFDPENVTNEITQLDNVCSKYRTGLECGALDPEEYLDKFNEELKAAGIDTVIAQKQEQMNQWLESGK